MQVFADNFLVWEGSVGRMAAFDGPVGIRSDNADLQMNSLPANQSKNRRRVAEAKNLNRLHDTSPGAMFAQYGTGPPPPGYGGQAGWDAPPSEFNEAQRKGFQDGMVGARKDYENHRAPNVNNRDEYRHPNVPKGLREDYRMGFQRGYDLGVVTRWTARVLANADKLN